MKKLLSVLLLTIGISTTIYSQTAEWVPDGTDLYFIGGKASIGTDTPAIPAGMNLTLKGTQIIYGLGAGIFFGDNSYTPSEWGEYGIEYSGGGLNFWKPTGSNGGYQNNIFFLKDDGRVGIGTGTPTADFLLTVAGGINAQEILVTETAGGADFVFAEDYQLRTLFDVEEFVKKNRHLPEIPSAQQMEQDGINMGELQIKLLQKVEELTLYIIQQQKEIEALKARFED